MPVTLTGELSFPALISAHEPFIVFSLPCSAEEGRDGVALVGTWHTAPIKPPQSDKSHTEIPAPQSKFPNMTSLYESSVLVFHRTDEWAMKVIVRRGF